jgi:hypothetical protein
MGKSNHGTSYKYSVYVQQRDLDSYMNGVSDQGS